MTNISSSNRQLKNYKSQELKWLMNRAIRAFKKTGLKLAIVMLYPFPNETTKKLRYQMEFNAIPKRLLRSEKLDPLVEFIYHISYCDYYKKALEIGNDLPIGLNIMNIFELENESLSMVSIVISDAFYDNLEDEEDWILELVKESPDVEDLYNAFQEVEQQLVTENNHTHSDDKLPKLHIKEEYQRWQQVYNKVGKILI
ncbi:MAG: hypothetical protein KI793_32995 [Rivularia sp. (in: Bacteria)]|nr:hypothetical protein [Rivularia sp. MS3]